MKYNIELYLPKEAILQFTVSFWILVKGVNLGMWKLSRNEVKG